MSLGLIEKGVGAVDGVGFGDRRVLVKSGFAGLSHTLPRSRLCNNDFIKVSGMG